MKGNLRFIILKELQKKERSGYGLMKSIQEQLGKKPSPGSMYPLLDTLHKEKIIKKRSIGKKDIYSLTAKGRSEVKKLNTIKDTLFKNLEKSIKMWGFLYNEDVDAHIQAIQSMKKDVQPFKEIQKESKEMKLELFRIYTDKKIKKHQKKIRDILTKATKELKKLK